ncbi:MAG: class I SAM-dependent methyltransferase, partial [Ktedonobacteraceae bacterium]
MKPDPDYSEYLASWTEGYDRLNYTGGLAGYFLKKSHAWCENTFSKNDHFPVVLEVGAGTGIHIQFVRHKFDKYIMTDLNPPMLTQIKPPMEPTNGTIVVEKEDATRLSFSDNSFDRVIAAHILEHLYKPYEVLREWHRVLKPGGVLSLVLPCDPGLAWRLGRSFGPRRKFEHSG